MGKIPGRFFCLFFFIKVSVTLFLAANNDRLCTQYRVIVMTERIITKYSQRSVKEQKQKIVSKG